MLKIIGITLISIVCVGFLGGCIWVGIKESGWRWTLLVSGVVLGAFGLLLLGIWLINYN